MSGKIIFALMLLLLTEKFLNAAVIPADNSYKIGLEDQLRIYVDRHADLTVSVPVGPDGYISYPLVGNVLVVGMTREELRQHITKLISKYIKNPQVSIVVEAYNSYKVAVLGEVALPGLFTLRSDPTVMHALSLAGGPKDSASLDEAYLKKASSEELIRLDLYSLLVRGDTSKNLELGPGDVIFIPKGTKNQIYILGEVASPGVYPMKEGMTLLEAIAMAGSETAKAITRKTSVIRKKDEMTESDIYVINVDKILKEGRLEFNIPLEPGDVVYLPKSAKPDWDRIAPMLSTIGTTHSLISGW